MPKKRFILLFPPDSIEKPLTYHLVKNYDLKVNILRATITPGKAGELLLEVEADAEAIEKGLEYLRQHRVHVKPIVKKIQWLAEDCIHCGACTAVCASGALRISQQTWELEFDPEHCIACELCLKACPLRLMSVSF
jgi:ferredoxin